MKNIIIKFFAILICILPLAILGNAQPMKVSEFRIPFEFIIKGKVFPAGIYSIERLNQGNPNSLILKNTNGKQKVVFIALNSGGDEAKEPQLTFKRFDERYFLETVRMNGGNNGQKVLLNIASANLPKTQKEIPSDANKCLPTVAPEKITPQK